MIVYKKKMVEKEEFDYAICDCCQKTIAEKDCIEIQEMYHIRFQGGYGAIFGDGNYIACDLCQHCLKDLIGKYCREVNHEDS